MEKVKADAPEGGFVQTIKRSLIALVILFILGAFGYLASDINHRHYRLISRDGLIQVERGRFLPAGYKIFKPETSDLKAAYAPIPTPPLEKTPVEMVFDERTELDRALFGILAGWARKLFDSEKSSDLDLAVSYIRRIEYLPGISEEQRLELKTLRGDMAYQNGLRIIRDMSRQLQKARDEFKAAILFGTSRPTDAQEWINDLEQRLKSDLPINGIPTLQGPPQNLQNKKPASQIHRNKEVQKDDPNKRQDLVDHPNREENIPKPQPESNKWRL